MFESNIYNIEKKFDYDTIKATVSKSLEKITEEEAAFKNTSNASHDSKYDIGADNVDLFAPPTPLLKLKCVL